MASAQETRQLFLEQCRTKYSWASGATRGTPSAIQRHRRDLEVAFAEINGLMAAMHYQDQAEGSTAPAPSPSPLQASQEYNYPIQISDDLLEDMPGTYKPPAEPSITVDDQPMAPQWGAIRSLREESEFHHRRFQALARRLGDPIISELLDIYPDARSIRSKGTQLAKDVLEGFKPHKLSLVFAFTCFSYSISQHFYKKGHINKSDILADIRTWRDLIADPKERQAFNRLAPELWPETKEYLHFIEIPVNPERRNFHLSNFQPEILPQATGQTTIDRSGPLYISDQYPFGTMAPNPDPKDGLSFSHDIIDLMKISHEVYDFSALALSSGQSQYLQTADAVWSQPTSTNAPVPPIFPPEPPSKFDSPDWGGEGPQLANQPAEEVKLEETVMFLVVLAFLQDIGELLYILSGKSLASRRYKLYPAQQGDQEAFYRKAQEAFFKPCSQHRSSASPASRALVSVAEMFTQGGYLRSIAEIKHYLVGVAAAVLPPGAAFEQFLFSILADVPVTSPEATSFNKPRKRQQLEDDDSESAAKRDRKCEYEGCDATYSDLSGLRKHQMQCHMKSPPIRCGECDYGCPRRDRVRSHFLKLHPGVTLPERLREKGRPFQAASAVLSG